MSMTAAPDMPFVYLASASPRRRQLLDQIGVRWAAAPADVDETSRPGEPAAEYVSRLALAKARAARARTAAAAAVPVLAADTAVVINGQLLGKPASELECRRMLGSLAGAVHVVFTAVAVISPRGESVALSRSEVAFRDITAEEMGAYWSTGEPADKAGGYGIQGMGAIFIRELRGSYSGVMGLPLFETAALLREHGVPLLTTRGARP
jgi:septum formation protein